MMLYLINENIGLLITCQIDKNKVYTTFKSSLISEPCLLIRLRFMILKMPIK